MANESWLFLDNIFPKYEKSEALASFSSVFLKNFSIDSNALSY
jgi:hypothetical protein